MKATIYRHISKITPYIIGAASLIFAAQFLFHTIQSSFSIPNTFWIFLVVILSVCTFIGLRDEFKFVRTIKLVPENYQFINLSQSMLVITMNVLATYFIALFFDTSTIFAASLVCVLSTYAFPKHQAEAYSGSCGGMIGVYLSSHWGIALLTGIMTGLFYILFIPYFLGVGGRGGSLPYSATILTIRLFLNLNPEQRTPIEPEMIVPSFFAIIIVALITYMLHKKNIVSVVKAAMIMALICALVIPIEYYTLTTAAFAGTVVGMSIEERLDGYAHLLMISVITFILFVPAFHILDGIGGKLGILCLVSYYSSIGLKKLFIVFNHYFSKILDDDS